MRFQLTAFLVVFMTSGLIWAVIVPRDLPDGFWGSQQLANGTTITTSLDDPALPPIIEHEGLRSRIKERKSIEKRDAVCYGYFLDARSVDTCNLGIQATVFNGGVNNYWLSSDGRVNGAFSWIGQTLNGVLVYLCIDQGGVGISVNPGIIQEGMAAMDSVCEPYEAGWATFLGVGRIIMGKCAIGTAICL